MSQGCFIGIVGVVCSASASSDQWKCSIMGTLSFSRLKTVGFWWFLLRLRKSGAWEIPEAEWSYTEACQKDFWDHGNATVEGQDLASTYVLCPHPRTGCPDFRMGQKGVMGWGVMEQRCDRAESRVLGQTSAETRLIKRKMRIGKWAKLIFRLGSK